MKDEWYGDKRDIVKWTTLVHLAQRLRMNHILQVLYYRPSNWPVVRVGSEDVAIPEIVRKQFRDARSICAMNCGVQIEVLDSEFDGGNRDGYLGEIKTTIGMRKRAPGIVFLDPDTGLEPQSGKYGPTHVRERELLEIWNSLRVGDAMVMYQHETNRRGVDFILPKKAQFAWAIGIGSDRVTHSHAPGIAKDVAFLFALKPSLDGTD